MNVVKSIERANQRELDLGITASWHEQYKDSAYINISGLDLRLTEGDVIIICSQYGEIVDINMPRDQSTGKPRGFAFLMYEDQRSTVLAVDNLNGATVLGRTLRVDHVAKYKHLTRDPDTGKMVESEQPTMNAAWWNFIDDNEGSSDAESLGSVDEEDPMAQYILEQRRLKKKSSKKGETSEDREERKRQKLLRKQERAEKRAQKEERRRIKNRKESDDHPRRITTTTRVRSISGSPRRRSSSPPPYRSRRRSSASPPRRYRSRSSLSRDNDDTPRRRQNKSDTE